MKGLIKIDNRGKFYDYTIFDCQVINVQGFLYQFSIQEMALFGEVLVPNSPKYFKILLKFSPQVVFKETKTVLYEFLKKLLKTFIETRNTQSLHFWSNFDPFSPPIEDGRNKKTI